MIDDNEFIERVQQQARLSERETAVLATEATLRTLGERVSPDVSQALAQHLPAEMSTILRQSAGGKQFPLQQFFKRVATYESCNLSQAVHHARAVIIVLLQTLPARSIRQLKQHLPKEFAPLFVHQGGTNGQNRSSKQE